MGSNNFYVIDASSLINIRMHYPVTVFTSFWDKLSELALENRLAAPQTVFDELGQKDDDYLINWFKERKDKLVYTEYSEKLMEYVSEILTKYPKLIDENQSKEQADPFVIAMALEYRESPQKKLVSYEVCVVTDESWKTGAKKIRIPEVCDHYKIPCYKMLKMAEIEGWKF